MEQDLKVLINPYSKILAMQSLLLWEL